MTEPVIIIDAYGFVFRAYHVQPALTSPSGQDVGALYGFTSMLIKVLTDFKSSKIVVVFDSGGKNFRHEMYDQYKAHRPPIDDALKQQLPLVRIPPLALGLEIREQRGVEADDVIASMASKLAAQGVETIIISSDKDLMQLIGPHISMYDPIKAKFIRAPEVLEKFGVTPDKVRDVLALIGDKSDNIPGVPSIGPKTAAELIQHFGSLHELLGRLNEIPQAKRRDVLESNIDVAKLSWDLVGLKSDLDVDVENIKRNTPNALSLSNFISEYGFKSLAHRLERYYNISIVSDLYQSLHKVEDKAAPFDEVLSDASAHGMLAVLMQSGILTIFAPSGLSSTMTDNLQPVIAFFKDDAVKKITLDYKKILHYFSQHTDISDFIAFEDLSLMHYTVSAGQRFKIDNAYFLESGKSLFNLYYDYKALLYQHKAMEIYYDIDLPLCHILYDMEKTGIAVDAMKLSALSHEFAILLSKLEQEIYAVAGTEFNISSPKQLAEILFERLGLPKPKMLSKSQTFSTDADTLENLSGDGYAIADYLLRYRQLSKLKSTYTDALLKEIDTSTKRIHTSFIQTATSTGRLSSHEPNLQNIPTRTEEGQKIREAFIAPDGSVLVSADYSQIELRILSDLANISTMQEAFRNGVDIHIVTASQVFDMDIASVTPELRRQAKAINFGIIYGISAFGLAKQLNIPKDKAGQYIASYFKQYPGIEGYMQHIKEFARANGYVSNLFGRKCFIPTINDKNHALKNFAERAAINAPIQGTASDIAKLAMIHVPKALHKHGLHAKMLLQVHDELIFEVPEAEVDATSSLIKNVMEDVVTLQSGLIVDIHHGKNWAVI